jgi:hypothetical protein
LEAEQEDDDGVDMKEIGSVNESKMIGSFVPVLVVVDR